MKVLRLEENDKIEIIDGKGNLYEAIIIKADHKKCYFEVKHVKATDPSPLYRHIAIAPTKNIDRIEWFVEKAVEIGIDEISFIRCDHSERKLLKLERLKKKAISAMKQSYKFHLPKINELTTFSSFVGAQQASLKTIAYVDFENPLMFQSVLKPQEDCIILIGPEGDFSTAEVTLAMTNGYQKVSLGNSRLRTETAGLVACHLINLVTR